MDTPNAWSARDKGREASNDYHQKDMKAPLNGYTDGEISQYTGKMSALSSQGESNVDGNCSMKGIKEESPMDGYLEDNNQAYKGL